MIALDLTAEEQRHVRAALNFLHLRCGGWEPVAKILHFQRASLNRVARGRNVVSPTLAFRIAKFVKVSVDDLLVGKFPAPGTCPHCGHQKDDES